MEDVVASELNRQNLEIPHIPVMSMKTVEKPLIPPEKGRIP